MFSLVKKVVGKVKEIAKKVLHAQKQIRDAPSVQFNGSSVSITIENMVIAFWISIHITLFIVATNTHTRYAVGA